MNIEKFVDQLNLQAWESSEFQADVCKRVSGFSSPYIMKILNLAVTHLEGDEIYLEVGSNQGRTLIGAIGGRLDERPGMAIAVDNFSQFNEDGKTKDRLLSNLTSFRLHHAVRVFDEDCTEFFKDILPGVPDNNVGVYFYDGNHDPDQGLNGLKNAIPFLAKHAVIVMDDIAGPGIWESVIQFIGEYPNTRILFAMNTNNFPFPNENWWNGIIVLGWERGD